MRIVTYTKQFSRIASLSAALPPFKTGSDFIRKHSKVFNIISCDEKDPIRNTILPYMSLICISALIILRVPSRYWSVPPHRGNPTEHQIQISSTSLTVSSIKASDFRTFINLALSHVLIAKHEEYERDSIHEYTRTISNIFQIIFVLSSMPTWQSPERQQRFLELPLTEKLSTYQLPTWNLL